MLIYDFNVRSFIISMHESNIWQVYMPLKSIIQ